MFEHSIKVPRLYKEAAKIAKEASENGTSFKQLVYDAKHVNIKGIYALAIETTKHKDELDYLIRKSKLLKKEPRLDPWLCRILMTELLWRKKKLSGESKPVKTVLAYKQILNAHASEISNDISEKETPVVSKPKYIRVNTLKATVEEIINIFRDEGWTFVSHFEDNNYNHFLSKLSSLGPEEFMLDLHVNNLLIFPPKTEFYLYQCYKDGRIMIQDKASCLPAILLNPQPGSTVLDMCAAPGMKTTQIAALMKNQGTIYAVEFSTKRFESLNKMVKTSGATCVKTINRDVMTLTSNDCRDVDYILIDPSCSGSGIVDRNDFNKTKEIKTNLDRLEKLAGFQIKILKIALNRFPKAKKIVYSTCSLYTQENEEVVKEVLASSTKFKLVSACELLKAPWNNFGSSEYGDIGKFCLYSRPEKDHTNGFFVAVFERLEEGEENPFVVINLERKMKLGKGVDNDIEIVDDSDLVKKKKKINKRKASNTTEVNVNQCDDSGKPKKRRKVSNHVDFKNNEQDAKNNSKIMKNNATSTAGSGDTNGTEALEDKTPNGKTEHAMHTEVLLQNSRSKDENCDEATKKRKKKQRNSKGGVSIENISLQKQDIKGQKIKQKNGIMELDVAGETSTIKTKTEMETNILDNSAIENRKRKKTKLQNSHDKVDLIASENIPSQNLYSELNTKEKRRKRKSDETDLQMNDDSFAAGASQMENKVSKSKKKKMGNF